MSIDMQGRSCIPVCTQNNAACDGPSHMCPVLDWQSRGAHRHWRSNCDVNGHLLMASQAQDMYDWGYHMQLCYGRKWVRSFVPACLRTCL